MVYSWSGWVSGGFLQKLLGYSGRRYCFHGSRILYDRYFVTSPQLTYQTLIPKYNCAHTPSEFRPISLCNITYKIISKLLALRLKPFLSKLVSPWQAAHVPGRNIMDNTIIAHEMVDYTKRTKLFPGVIAVKLDMTHLIVWNGIFLFTSCNAWDLMIIAAL